MDITKVSEQNTNVTYEEPIRKMGVSLEVWRCRIGIFSPKGPKWKWKMLCIVVAGMLSGALRAWLLFSLCACFTEQDLVLLVNSKCVSPEWVVYRVGNLHYTCDRTTLKLSEKWQVSVQGFVTRACSGDIELNPGPGPPPGPARNTRQSTLSTSGELSVSADPKLVDVMKGLKSLEMSMNKRFDEVNHMIDSKIDEMKEDISVVQDKQTALDQKLAKRKSALAQKT